MDRITIYGPTELNSQASHEFLTCLANTVVEYRIYIDQGGIIVVLPSDRRELDEDGKDEGLFECIKDVNTRMEVVVESTEYSPETCENIRWAVLAWTTQQSSRREQCYVSI